MYPNLVGKKYVNLSNNVTSSVISQDGDVALLDDNMNVSIIKLLDKSAYDDFIDPAEFLTKSAYNLLSEKIKAVPDEVLEQMQQDAGIVELSTGYNNFNPGGESLIIDVDPSEERRLLEDRVSQMSNGSSSLEQARIQSDMLQSIIDDSGVVEVHQPISTNVPSFAAVVTEDPIYVMFKGVKRSKEFSVDVKIAGMIPRIDFIEMMEDSYNTSIIEYLADEFTNKLLADPNAIKQLIIDEINKIVSENKLGGVVNPTIVESTVVVNKKPRTPRSNSKTTPTKKLTQ